MSRLTESQRLAIEVRGASVALSAGAGCGKTTVLTEKYLSELTLDTNRPLSRVAALTFTEKAARELRGRVRTEARRAASGEEDSRFWKGIVRGLEAARIGTFHSFCSELLKRYAIEAGIDPAFSALDDYLATHYRSQAIDQAIREGLIAGDADLETLAVEFGMEVLRDHLDEFLSGRESSDLESWTNLSTRDLLARWKEVWASETLPDLVSELKSKLAPTHSLLREIADDFPDKSRAAAKLLFSNLDRAIRSIVDEAELLDIREAAKIKDYSALKKVNPEIHDTIKTCFGEVRKSIDEYLEKTAFDENLTVLSAALGLALARLALKARGHYESLKAERGVLDFDDQLIKLRNLLRDRPETAGAELSRSLDILLVDEFQDTDPVQAEILDRLAASKRESGGLFLVGDHKQSIYGFRGARPELFRKYRESFPEEGRLPLSENFRSTPAVLDFVNGLFAEAFDEPYESLLVGGAFASDPALLGQVTFLWGAAEAPGSAIEDARSKAQAKPAAREHRDDEARRIARLLRERLDAGWIIRDRKHGGLRPATGGDVALLFRTLSDSRSYEAALDREGLEYRVVGGKSFYANQEIQDVINVLSAVENPLDSVALAGALRGPFFSVSDEALFVIASRARGELHQGLNELEDRDHEFPTSDRPRVAFARDFLRRARALKDRVGLGAFTEFLIVESGFELAILGETLGDRKRANARKLIALARRYDEEPGFTLADFVTRLREWMRNPPKEDEAVTVEDEGDAVRLMTIHQSKGLEFPIVVTPNLDRKTQPSLARAVLHEKLGPLVSVSAPETDGTAGKPSARSGTGLGWRIYKHADACAEAAESLRLFYVAATRARDCLILSASEPLGEKTASPALRLLDRCYDRATGEYRGAPLSTGSTPSVEVVLAPIGDDAEDRRRSRRRSSKQSREVCRVIRESDELREFRSSSGVERSLLADLDPTSGLSESEKRIYQCLLELLVSGRHRRFDSLVSPFSAATLRKATRLFEYVIEGELGRLVEQGAFVERGPAWVMTWPNDVGDFVTYSGSIDLLVRSPDERSVSLVFLSPSCSDPIQESRRLELSMRAVDDLGLPPVLSAWRIDLGEA